MEKVIEICCGSYEDALNAYLGGAKRIELNSGLHLGGLTPSLGTLLLSKKNTNLKIIVMIRPRGAGFCYSDEEFEVMKEDARIMMKNGAHGLAFGCLDENGQVHLNQTREIVDIIKAYQGEAVFHRAFDCVRDYHQAIQSLIYLGVDRILTSGLKQKAIEGMDIIKELQEQYGDKIEVLAGSGVNASNAKEIMEKTGICQVHSSCKDWIEDPTTLMGDVSFSFDSVNGSSYDVVSRKLVEKIVNSL